MTRLLYNFDKYRLKSYEFVPPILYSTNFLVRAIFGDFSVKKKTNPVVLLPQTKLSFSGLFFNTVSFVLMYKFLKNVVLPFEISYG